MPRKEVEIESKLTEHIQKFLLELGQGFAFVGRQVHLEVGGQDFYIDLLFYHLKLRCYVVIELKACDFEPGFISQLSYNEVHQSSPKSSPKDVNQTQQKIIEMILSNPKITQTAMAEELGVTARAVKKSIKELNEKGILERVGSARSGYWEVKDN